MPHPTRRRAWLALAAAVAILAAAPAARAQGLAVEMVSARFSIFVTILLGIFIEAVPFLLAGSLVSGFVEVFVDPRAVQRFIPRHPVAASASGALLGLAFPVCECGVVPVTRRLYAKGMAPSAGIAFLMAAPVVNPVVIASTYAAFGWGPIFIGRIVLSIVIAIVVGLAFGLAGPDEVLREEIVAGSAIDIADTPRDDAVAAPWRDRVVDALGLAGDDFVDMGRYLVAGSMMAAGMQTVLPQSTLLTLASGPVIAVVVMMLVAFVLSVCSTVDAFLALAFVNTFSPAAILAFLVFGPMVDIKSALMFFGVFRRRAVVYLILLPLALTLVVCVFLSLNVRFPVRW